jgi:hypothetical protein
MNPMINTSDRQNIPLAPESRTVCREQEAGARPDAFIPKAFFALLSQKIAKQSPPIPVLHGSVTFRAAATAISRE